MISLLELIDVRFVCTYEARALGGSPVLLSTYSTNSAHINCTIWEAARATSAEPIFFPPIKLADHAGGDFMDTGVGFNNPTKILVKEAKSYYRLKGYSASQPTCLVSIGTGQKDPTQTQRAASLFWFKDRGGMSISPVLEEIFTDCENTHDEVTQSCVEDDATDIYFRFNVLQGMQNIVLDEWTKPNDIRTYTDKYMRLNQTSHEISECIKLLRCKVREVGNGDFERLLAMNDLAITLQNQGNLKEATRMYTEVLKKAKQMYGGEHLNTLSAMTKLAIALNYQGEREVATRLFTEVVEKKKQILGDEHPDTLSSMSNLANILSQQQKFAAAVAIGKGVLEKRKRILGEEHLDTISGMSNLAIVLKLQGKFEEATMMFTKVFEKREQVLGDKHPDTISAMSNLANTLLAQNNLEAAVAMGKEVLRKLTRILGSEHLDSISALDNLAIALECQGKHEEAAVMFTKVFEKREQVLGDEHPDTILAKQLLSHALAGQGKLQEGATIAARQDVTGKQ
jgi:tetratricopeptide (TPR) repeat protein